VIDPESNLDAIRDVASARSDIPISKRWASRFFSGPPSVAFGSQVPYGAKGIAVSAKGLLEFAVMLLGASISFAAIVESGPAPLGGIVPLLIPLLRPSETQYGVLAGLTVYAVPQVLAATVPISPLSAQVGTLVKLVRVLMLGPVVILLSLFRTTLKVSSGSTHLDWRHLAPWFIVGFLLIAVMRSFDLIPHFF
jgi:uncharacterized membrane protein YadS